MDKLQRPSDPCRRRPLSASGVSGGLHGARQVKVQQVRDMTYMECDACCSRGNMVYQVPPFFRGFPTAFLNRKSSGGEKNPISFRFFFALHLSLVYASAFGHFVVVAVVVAGKVLTVFFQAKNRRKYHFFFFSLFWRYTFRCICFSILDSSSGSSAFSFRPKSGTLEEAFYLFGRGVFYSRVPLFAGERQKKP